MKNAHALFGPQRISSIKGKTTRRAPEHVRTDYVAVPGDILKLQKNVTLVVDVMFDQDRVQNRGVLSFVNDAMSNTQH